MDPNTTLEHVAYLLSLVESQGSYSHYAGEQIDYACQDLYDWLTAGGFEPDWSKHELAASYYRCRAIAHDRGERLA